MAGASLGTSLSAFLIPNKYGFAPYEILKLCRNKNFIYQKDIKKIYRRNVLYNIFSMFPSFFLAVAVAFALISLSSPFIDLNSINASTGKISSTLNLMINVTYNATSHKFETSLAGLGIASLVLNSLALALTSCKFIYKRIMMNFKPFEDQPYYAQYLKLLQEDKDVDEEQMKLFRIIAYITYGIVIVVLALNIVCLASPIDINGWIEGKPDFPWYVKCDDVYSADKGLHITNIGFIVFSILAVILEVASVIMLSKSLVPKLIVLMAAIWNVHIEQQNKVNIVYDNDISDQDNNHFSETN